MPTETIIKPTAIENFFIPNPSSIYIASPALRGKREANSAYEKAEKAANNDASKNENGV